MGREKKYKGETYSKYADSARRIEIESLEGHGANVRTLENEISK